MNSNATLITGSTAGIGLDIAKSCVAKGRNVIFNGRNKKRLDLITKNFRNQRVSGVAADVTSKSGVNKIYKHVKDNYGKLDGLVCNVGSGRGKPPGDETLDDWNASIDVNFFSALNLIYKFNDLMYEDASIVCISSICGVKRLSNAPIAYSVSKAALIRFVSDYATVLSKSGVRINCISPGNILFEGSTWETKLMEDRQKVYDMIEKKVPLNMLGEPSDISNLALYLLSDASRFVTGANFVIDGGQVC